MFYRFVERHKLIFYYSVVDLAWNVSSICLMLIVCFFCLVADWYGVRTSPHVDRVNDEQPSMPLLFFAKYSNSCEIHVLAFRKFEPLFMFNFSCIRAPLVSTPVWGRDFASPEDLVTEFCRECRIVRKGYTLLPILCSRFCYFCPFLLKWKMLGCIISNRCRGFLVVVSVEVARHRKWILIVWWRAGLDGDLKKAMKDGKPVIIEVIITFFLVGIQQLLMQCWQSYSIFFEMIEVIMIIIKTHRSHVSFYQTLQA